MSPYRTSSVNQTSLQPGQKETIRTIDLGWIKCELETIQGDIYHFEISGTGPEEGVFEQHADNRFNPQVITAFYLFAKILTGANSSGWVIIPNEREDAIPFSNVKRLSKIEVREVKKTWRVRDY